MRAERG